MWKRMANDVVIFVIAGAAVHLQSCRDEEVSVTAPKIETAAISDIGLNSVTSGGTITTLGDTEVTARGVVWGRNPQPTLGNLTSSTNEGPGTGTYQSAVTGLTSGTYYIRAYAISDKVTYYGNEIEYEHSVIPELGISGPFALTGSSGTVNVTLQYTPANPVTEKGICWGTSKLPLPDRDQKQVVTETSSAFSVTLSNLSQNKTYYIRAYAITQQGVFYSNVVQLLLLPPTVQGEVQDVEGNTYRTVVIANQTWIAENLRVTKFSDGSPIPVLTSEGDFKVAGTSACIPYQGNSANLSAFGYLYNGFVTTSGKNVCMTGWHVPTSGEWYQLADALGGMETAGGRMKALDAAWQSPNTSATNESGFSGLPGGSYCRACLSNSGVFADKGTDGYWWSQNTGDFFYLTHNLPELRTKTGAGIQDGMSIRCIKD